MGSYTVEESRDRIVANNMALAMTIAEEFCTKNKRMLRRYRFDDGDVENEAFALLVGIVDSWDREAPFDAFCKKELPKRLRGAIDTLTGARRKHSEEPAGQEWELPGEGLRVAARPPRMNGAPLRQDDGHKSASPDEWWELVKTRLSEEEFFIAEEVSKGVTDKAIGEKMGVHRTTVASRRNDIERKLSSIRGEIDKRAIRTRTGEQGPQRETGEWGGLDLQEEV